MSKQEREAMAETIYRALTQDTARLRDMRRLQYRCANPERRCLLLDVIDTGEDGLGVILHRNRYKYSEHENEARSNEAGRARNTYDGQNHWRGYSAPLESTALNYPDDNPPMSVQLSCDHVLGYQLYAQEFHADLASDTREVRIRGDLTRYGV